MAYFSIKSFTDGVQALVLSIRGKLGTKPDARIGVRTGFSTFDQRTRGFHEGKLYVLAARPGGGKTSMVTTMMANIAMSQPDVPLLMFSTELTEEEVIMQMVEAYAGGVPVYPNGRVSTSEEVEKLEASLMAIGDQVNKSMIKIIHKKRLSEEFLDKSITAHCDVILDGQSAVVFIDQANRIAREDKSKHGYAIATEHMLNALEDMADKQNVPIILVTQLNRMTELQKHATMSNLKHSGGYEEFAHAVYLLEKDADHGQRKGGSAYINHGAVCHIAKNRHGIVGPINFNFHGECHHWTESTDREER